MPAVSTADTLLSELFGLSKASRALLGRQPAPGLTVATAGVLALLVRAGELRCGAVAELMGVDASVVSRQLAELERHGLAGRRADPLDGRASLSFATPAGREVVAGLRERHASALAESLSGWSDEELHQVIATLRRLSADLLVAPRPATHHVPAEPAGRKALA